MTGSRKWLKAGAIFIVATMAFAWSVTGVSAADPSLPTGDDAGGSGRLAPPQPPTAALAPQAPEAPLPPQAPIEGTGAGVDQLPSAGSGGYLPDATNWALVIIMSGIAVLGSGSLVWAFGNRKS